MGRTVTAYIRVVIPMHNLRDDNLIMYTKENTILTHKPIEIQGVNRKPYILQ